LRGDDAHYQGFDRNLNLLRLLSAQGAGSS
jgi:hypothetical protein